MDDSTPQKRRGHITDARGRKVAQIDPVALHLLRRHDVIPADSLRSIAEAIDPMEVKRRLRMALWTPILIILCYAGFFGYFNIFNRWRGWDPVLVCFATFYFICPIAILWFGYYRARRARRARIARIMLQHRHCPHCGYDIRGLPPDGNDGATVCPECGCAWKLHDESQTEQPEAALDSRG